MKKDETVQNLYIRAKYVLKLKKRDQILQKLTNAQLWGGYFFKVTELQLHQENVTTHSFSYKQLLSMPEIFDTKCKSTYFGCRAKQPNRQFKTLFNLIRKRKLEFLVQ